MTQPETFDINRKFVFSNQSNEDFEGQWAGEKTLIKAGETKEFPMYLAYHFTKHLVDREMNKAGKASLIGIEEARKEYEQKYLAEIGEGTDSPALAALKEKIRQEVLDVQEKKVKSKKETKEESATSKEFSDLK